VALAVRHIRELEALHMTVLVVQRIKALEDLVTLA
jgi:hypothetical protein